MKPKTLILLAVAGGCGLFAMLGVQQAMSGSQTAAEVETAQVLVALEDVNTGMRLTEDNVAFRAIPVDSLPEDAVRTEEEYIERAAAAPLLTGDIIRTTRLTEKGGWGQSMNIQKGMRVIAIPVSDTDTVSGLLSPGDRVDISVTYRGPGGRNGGAVSKTKTLLEYIEVFSTDAKTKTKIQNGGETNRAKNVSLVLTPEQVTFVRLAQSKGQLGISMRHRMDDEVVQSKEIDEELFDELSGSIGVNDDRPAYAQGMDIYDPELSATDEDEKASFIDEDDTEEESPSRFLDNVEEQAPPEAVVLAAPPKPLWSMHIYNGNAPAVQEFEIEEEAVEETEEPSESETASVLSFGSTIRSFWKGNNSEAAEDEAEVAEPEAETVPSDDGPSF